MRRTLLRWLAPLLVAGVCLVPAPAQQGGSDGMRFNTSPDGKQATGDDAGSPVFAYFIAISATVLVLFTLMKPSRRRQ